MKIDPHKLGEERSIAMHREIGKMLYADPLILEQARDRVAGWLADGSVHKEYAKNWAVILEGDLAAICALLVDESDDAKALRQNSPFAGALPPKKRWQIRKQIAAEYST